MKMRKKLTGVFALVATAAVLVPAVSYAATNPNLTQAITNGVLSIDIVDGSGVSVASPAIAFPSKSFDFDCQDSVATLASTTNKIAVSNPKKAASNTGVKVDINATTPDTDWTSGSDTYAYNDAAGSGCTSGQLSVSGIAFTKTAGTSTLTSGTDYTLPGGSFSSTSAVTLLNVTKQAAWEGEITDLTLTQKLPAEQAAGSYSLGMTVSAISQ